MINDKIDCDGGEIFKSKEARIDYLEQHTALDSDNTIWEEMLTILPEIKKNEANFDEKYYRSKIKGALIGLGFSEDEFSIPFSKLSGGQKTRIQLCKILLSEANLLLLDEPTNHLDIDSIKWLEDFLINYKGTFIVISHDRYFLDRVTTKTFELENKKFNSFDGNYSEYVIQKEIEKLTKERNYNSAITEIQRLEEVVEQQRRMLKKQRIKIMII